MTDTAKGVGLFGRIKGAFVEEVPEARASAPPPVAQNYVVGTTPAPALADPEVVKKLEAKLKANMPNGYVQFLEQYNGLQEVIPDEGMRFKAALKTSKITVEEVSQALEGLTTVLVTAQTDFQNTFEQNRAKVQTAMEQSIKATEDLIQSREQQLKAIQEEVASLRAKCVNDVAQSKADTARLETIRAGFEAAYAQVVGRLNDQKTRVASQRG